MTEQTIMIVTGKLPDHVATIRQHFDWMMEDLNREAERMGWAGVELIKYGLAGGWALIEAKAGDTPLTLERLQKFRDEQRRRREEEEGQVA